MKPHPVQCGFGLRMYAFYRLVMRFQNRVFLFLIEEGHQVGKAHGHPSHRSALPFFLLESFFLRPLQIEKMPCAIRWRVLGLRAARGNLRFILSCMKSQSSAPE